MGLDGVELVINIEDRFDASISDSAAEKIQMDRIRHQNSGSCPSVALFYPICKILVDDFAIKRSVVRLSTPLELMECAGVKTGLLGKNH